MSLRRVFEADKAIAAPVKWTDPDREDGHVRFLAILEIEGLADATYQLSGGAYVNIPEEHVTFELAVVGDRGLRRTRLARIDWRSITGGHTNKRNCPGRWAGRRSPNTHFHDFELNWVESEQRMRKGKLPCARPLDAEPQGFEALRKQTGLLFRINNMQIVPHPPWMYDLFSGV